MLYRSGDNLLENTKAFIETSQSITLFSAYLKLDQLKKLNESKKVKQIVVRWEIQDLCLGVSDLDLYYYCQENNIVLYRNTRIHLKAFWDNSKKVVFGSANVTGRGTGEENNFNFELNGCFENLSYNDICYLNQIILTSECVTSTLFEEIKGLVEQTQLPTVKYPKLETKRNPSDYFLLSSLPMTQSVEDLYLGYYAPDRLNDDEVIYVAHDIALYNISKGFGRIEFYEYLKESFNNHPFILKLKEYIKNCQGQSLNYGRVVKWIQNNTTTVPTPRSWEMKKAEIVNILYSWICELDEDYTWDVPGSRSEVIYYKRKVWQIDDLVESLNRDRARGKLAPHQILLLLALSKIFKNSESKSTNVNNLDLEFQKVWGEYRSLFETTNNNVGMPLKAFVNKGLVELEASEVISDFRNVKELSEKISYLTVQDELLNALCEEGVEEYLVSRIDR